MKESKGLMRGEKMKKNSAGKSYWCGKVMSEKEMEETSEGGFDVKAMRAGKLNSSRHFKQE